jgi:hypothetical protein
LNFFEVLMHCRWKRSAIQRWKWGKNVKDSKRSLGRLGWLNSLTSFRHCCNHYSSAGYNAIKMARCVEKVNRFRPIPTSSAVIQQWKQEKRGDKRVTQWKEEANRRRGRTRLKRVESIGYWLVECCGLGDALREGTVPITIRIERVTRWLKSTWQTEGKKIYIAYFDDQE